MILKFEVSFKVRRFEVVEDRKVITSVTIQAVEQEQGSAQMVVEQVLLELEMLPMISLEQAELKLEVVEEY